MPTSHSTSTLRVGRLAGIQIGIEPLWLLIVAFITFALGHDYFPAEDPGLSPSAAYALGLASALGLFGGIVLHELGHAIVARRRGVQGGLSCDRSLALWLSRLAAAGGRYARRSG